MGFSVFPMRQKRMSGSTKLMEVDLEREREKRRQFTSCWAYVENLSIPKRRCRSPHLSLDYYLPHCIF